MIYSPFHSLTSINFQGFDTLHSLIDQNALVRLNCIVQGFIVELGVILFHCWMMIVLSFTNFKLPWCFSLAGKRGFFSISAVFRLHHYDYQMMYVPYLHQNHWANGLH